MFSKLFSKLMACTCGSSYGDVAPLVLRVVLGIIFAWHGYDKVFVTGLPAISDFLGNLGFPLSQFFAYILAYGELIGGVLLILGLFTHWIAKYDSIVALVALILVHWKNGFSAGNGGYEYILLILAASLSLLITGAGKYSLDARWKKGNPAQTL